MNNIIQTLLGGTALCALATTPAMAGDIPDFHAVALHPGHAKFFSKTGMHTGDRTHLTSTLSVFSTIPAELHKTVELPDTTIGYFCSTKLVKAKITKKPTNGKAGFFTQTVSTGCNGGPEVYVGNTYKLTNPKGGGDRFSDTITEKVTYEGEKYKITTNLDVQLTIVE